MVTKPMPVVFVAGPFRGPNAWEIELNIRRAEELALEVWKLGAAAICPHSMNRFFFGTLDEEYYLRGDLELLRRSDAMIMVHDWERSTGARAERKAAIVDGTPVFYTIPDLKEFLDR